MIQIKPEIEAAAMATSGVITPQEVTNNRHLVALEAVQNIPQQLGPQHRMRLTTAIESSLALRDQFDRQINPQAVPISRPAVKGFASSQIPLKGYRLSLLNALASVKPVDQALASGYKQACLESQLECLVKNITKLQKITDTNPGSTQEYNRASMQQLYQFVLRRRNDLSNGLDRGAVEIAHQLSDILAEKIKNKEYTKVIDCAKELVKSFQIADHSMLRNMCSQLPAIMKAVSLVNKHAGYSHICMKASESNGIDERGNLLSGAAILVILTGVKGADFSFHKKNKSDAQKKTWYKDWSITEYKRGSEERTFIAENKRSGRVSLVKHYPVHPDAEGGYKYEETLIGLMNNLPDN